MVQTKQAIENLKAAKSLFTQFLEQHHIFGGNQLSVLHSRIQQPGIEILKIQLQEMCRVAATELPYLD